MITYVNTDSGGAVRRGMAFRVTLRGGLDLSYLLNPLVLGGSWSAFVERWRNDVAAGKSLASATVSPAAITDGNISASARAIVDVSIHGAEAGVSVSSLAESWDGLISGIDVSRIEQISAPDASGRSRELGTAITSARDPLGLKSFFSDVRAVLVLLIVGYVIVTYRRRSRGDF